MEGFVMAQRRILELFEKDAAGSHLYARLLREASIKDRVILAAGAPVSLKKGQLVFGIHQWMDKTGLTERVIRGRLKVLEDVGEVVKQSKSKYSILSVTSLMEGQADVKQESGTGQADVMADVHSKNNEYGKQQTEEGSSKDSLSPSPKTDERVSQVIAYLNELTGSRYKATTKAHAENINARLADGHCLDDLMTVVRHKASEWKDDPRMAGYLRPQTLFQTGKFDGYLLAAKAPGKPAHSQYQRPPTPIQLMRDEYQRQLASGALVIDPDEPF